MAALNHFSPLPCHDHSSSKFPCCLSDCWVAALIEYNVDKPHLSQTTMKTSSIVFKLNLCICLKNKNTYIAYLIIVSKSESPHKTKDAFQRAAELPRTIFMSLAQAKCSTGKYIWSTTLFKTLKVLTITSSSCNE